MSKPARPELRFSSFDQMLADVDRLRSTPYERSGQWDLPQILDHLTKAMSMPFKPGATSMPWPVGAVARLMIHRMVAKNQYPSMKFPAPPVLRPAADVDLQTASAGFSEAIARVEAVQGETVQFPPFGSMPLSDFRGLQLLHGAHHLSFLRPRG